MKRLRILVAVAFAAVAAATIGTLASPGSAESYATKKPSCADVKPFCAEVADPRAAFPGYPYVGHDEPSVEYYSSVAGSGNNSTWELTLPRDPEAGCTNANGNVCNVMLRPAFWFGMAMCDTQSYPEQKSTCTPDSNTNIVDPTKTKIGPGAAFEELQFYPPGWAPQFAGSSCDPTRYCAALNIDSLSEDPIAGTTLNSTCQSQILGGVEYVNFAYLTHNGVPIGPPNPLHFAFNGSGNPQGKSNVEFMNAGDDLQVTLHDTTSGLQTTVTDVTAGTMGTMTASAANHFGQIQFQPTGTGCTETDYNFHPMYSTSSPQTRVLWAAHSYNIAFSDEIGHFDWCSHLDVDQGGICGPRFAATTGGPRGLEGKPGVDQERAEAPTSATFDDFSCFPAEASLNYQLTGCNGTNTPGFDGAPYLQSSWPNGNVATAPSPILFSSPLSGTSKYGKYAFEADLPRIEASDLGGVCDRNTGTGCVNPPVTDDTGVNAFYPYFVLMHTADSQYPLGCQWALGDMGTATGVLNPFTGSSAEFNPLYPLAYWSFGGGGTTTTRFNDFNSGPKLNGC